MDHRVDLYAFGVMAYEMLTGQPPFTGRTPQAVLGAHIAALPEPVTARRPGVPPLLADAGHAVPGEARRPTGRRPRARSSTRSTC